MGSELVYSSFLGGNSRDRGNAIALDSAGNAFVTGQTLSDDFPTVDPFQANRGSRFNFDAFAAMVCSSGKSLLYSSYLGGRNREEGADIAVDEGGSVLLTGVTESRDFPTTDDAFQDMVNFSFGFSNVFFARVGPFDPVVILNDLIDFVFDPAQGFNPGTQNPLIDKLETAIAKIEDGNAANDQAIPSILSDFEAVVEARRDKKIDSADADYLIEEAERVSCFFGG